MNILNLVFLIPAYLLPNNTIFNNHEYNLSTVKMDYINQETGVKDLGNGYVANISIYSYNGISSSSTYFTGHAFSTIQNLTKDFLTIGKMNVEPYNTISIGTWPKNAHFGLWYNLESYLSKNNEFVTSVSLSEDITYGSLLKLNEYISSHDIWQPMINCASFALRAWNSTSNDKLLESNGVETPTHLKEIIIGKDNYKSNQYIPFNDNICFYEGANFISISPSEI